MVLEYPPAAGHCAKPSYPRVPRAHAPHVRYVLSFQLRERGYSRACAHVLASYPQNWQLPLAYALSHGGCPLRCPSTFGLHTHTRGPYRSVLWLDPQKQSCLLTPSSQDSIKPSTPSPGFPRHNFWFLHGPWRGSWLKSQEQKEAVFS